MNYKKTYLIIVLIICLLLIRNGYTQVPHTVYGVVQYANSTKPATPSIQANITTRPDEILTQSSPGCDYRSDTGQWSIQCSSFPSNWTPGEILHVEFNDGAYAVGFVDITLTSNPWDDAGTTIIAIPTYQITLSTNPSGLQVYADGNYYTSPKTFTWEYGSIHSLEAVSPQNLNPTTRYVFTSWSDGEPQNHNFTVPASNQTLTATYKTQFLLDVQSIHGNPQGTGWYDQNTTASFSVTTPDIQGTTRYLFIQWSGNYSGTNPSGSITMNAPKTVTAHWNTQHTLSVNSTHGSPQGSGWYNENETAYFSVTSPDVQGNSRYLFTSWMGDYTGTSTFGSVIMDSPKSVTAFWNTEHFLGTAINPVPGGTISPSPPGDWISSGTNTTINASAATGYQFVFWTGNITGSMNPHTFQMNSPISVTANFEEEHQITINTQPAGLTFSADGNTYTAPHTFLWAENTSHTIAVSSPINGQTGIRYIFSSWSDGGAQNHIYIVPASNQTITASFENQYLLTVQSDHGNPQGSGWYDENATANFSVTTPDIQGTTRYIFNSWGGDYSGSSPSGSVLMDRAKSISAYWTKEYYLTTSENPIQGGDISPSPPGGWYVSNTTASINASPAAGYQFNGWTGDLSGNTNPTTIQMTSAKNVTANFGKYVQISITTNPSGISFYVDGQPYTTTQIFIWAENTSHTIGVNSTINTGVGTREIFTSWSDGGAQTHTYIVPGSNQTVTANFITQYYLTVQSDHGNPQGAGWYIKNSDASFSVTSPDINGTTRNIFTQWTGDYSGTLPYGSITMNMPKTVSAEWLIQYYLEINNGGYGAVFGEGWYTKGSNASFHISPTGIPVSTGIQNSFIGWTGTGNGAYTGLNAIATVTMNNPIQETAVWKEQYYLSIISNPSWGGSTQPGSPGEWFDPNTNANLQAIPNTAQNYQFSQWSGDVTGNTNPVTITMNTPKSVTAYFIVSGTICITTQPPGLNVVVDDTSYTSPKYFNWISGSSHYIIAPEFQENSNQHRKAFMSWNDGGARGHWITIGQSTTYSAVYKSQYYIATAVNPAYTGQITPNPPGIWCDENENRKIEAAASSGYLFSGWTGDLTGSANPAYILIDGPKSITAHFGYTSVDENTVENVPNEYLLNQNCPNPFNPETAITYHIPERTQISLDIYNLKGQKIRTLDYGWKNAGSHTAIWNGKDYQGKNANSGIFLFILRSENFQQIRKGTLIR